MPEYTSGCKPDSMAYIGRNLKGETYKYYGWVFHLDEKITIMERAAWTYKGDRKFMLPEHGGQEVGWVMDSLLVPLEPDENGRDITLDWKRPEDMPLEELLATV